MTTGLIIPLYKYSEEIEITGKPTRARESLFRGGNLFPLFCLLFEFSAKSYISHDFLNDVFV